MYLTAASGLANLMMTHADVQRCGALRMNLSVEVVGLAYFVMLVIDIGTSRSVMGAKIVYSNVAMQPL